MNVAPRRDRSGHARVISRLSVSTSSGSALYDRNLARSAQAA